jgi:hypothetical protein
MAHECTQQFVRRERSLGMRTNVIGILIEILINEIDRLVLSIVLCLALFRRQLCGDNLTAPIE